MSIQGLAAKMSYTQSANAMAEVSISMMEKALDQVEQAGQDIATMIQATAVMPVDGSTFDVSV